MTSLAIAEEALWKSVRDQGAAVPDWIRNGGTADRVRFEESTGQGV